MDDRASQLGYGLNEFWLNYPAVPPARLIKILESRGIRGLIVAAILNGETLPDAFRELWKNFATVVIGLRTTKPALHFACNDQYFTAFEAVRQLIRLGYKRPGLVISQELDANVEYRFTAGFWSAQRSLPESDRLSALHFEPDNEKAFRAWVRRNRPDVIVCVHSIIKGWLDAMKLRAPNDIGLVHLDRTDELKGWAGMRQNNDLVGSAAVDILVGQLHRNEHGVPTFPKSILIQSTWIGGPTLRAEVSNASRIKAASTTPHRTASTLRQSSSSQARSAS